MSQELKEFASKDVGFRQFCDLFERAASDPDVQSDYMNWIVTRMREEDMLQGAREEGIEEVAMNMLQAGMAPEAVKELTGLSLERISELSK